MGAVMRVMQQVFQPQGTVAGSAGGPSDVDVGVGAQDVDMNAVDLACTGLAHRGRSMASVACL